MFRTVPRGLAAAAPYVARPFTVETSSAWNADSPLCSTTTKRILEVGGRRLNITGTWKRIIIDDAVKEAYLRRRLEKIEEECQIEDNPILRIMREAYIKTCFEKKG